MRLLSVPAGLLCALLAACASTPPRTVAPPPVVTPARAPTGTAGRAIANLASASASLVSGRVGLHAVDGGVRVTGIVGGLSRNGAHALQVHARGDCSAVDASSAGPYFDTSGRAGVAGSSERIVANADGVADVDLLLPGAVLGGGAGNDVAGRALVVLGSTPGALGARVACGVITIQP